MNIVERIVEKACEYNKKPGKAISASQLGSNLLEIYYSLTVDDDESLFEIGQADIGTLAHKGLEYGAHELLKKEPELLLAPEIELEYDLVNGWRITGTCDLIEPVVGENAIIHDYKFTKVYKGKKLKEEIAKGKLDDGYIIQINAYRFMYEKSTRKQADMVLDMFYKDANKIKGEPTYEAIKIPKIPDDEILSKAYGITNELDIYLETGKIPPKCEDVWTRKLRNGTVVDSKCEYYCNYKKICKHYNNRGKTNLETIGW